MCTNTELARVLQSCPFESIKETPPFLKYYPQSGNKASKVVDKPVDDVNNSEKRDSYDSTVPFSYFVEFQQKKLNHF